MKTMQLKQIFTSVLGVFLILGTAFTAVSQSSVFYAGTNSGNARFNDVIQLKGGTNDGKWVVAGSSDEANWSSWLTTLGSPTVTTLAINLAPGVVSALSTDTKVGFLMLISADFSTIQSVVRFPVNTVSDVFRIRTTNLPGTNTATMFISGNRYCTADPINSDGYYIAQLDNNFTTALPTKTNWYYPIVCKPRGASTSQYKTFQPWDVGSNSKVVFGAGTDFDYSWAYIQRLKSDGSVDVVENFPYHYGTAGELTGGTNQASFPYPKASQYNLILGSGAPTSSSIVLKAGRAGSLRSYTNSDYNYTGTDENGFPRMGKYPEDWFFSGVHPAGGRGKLTKSNYTYGASGYKPHTPTSRLGGIVVDRVKNGIYYGYCIQTYLPDGGPDFEPNVVAMDSTGAMKWYARLYNQKDVSTPDQYVDGLEIDYNTRCVYVVGRAQGNYSNNLWPGSGLKNNPSALGFQNSLTGLATVWQGHQSWLGKFKLDPIPNAKIPADIVSPALVASTFIAEYKDPASGLGGISSDPNLDNWPAPNNGNPDLNTTKTVVNRLAVTAGGLPFVMAVGRRVITTKNAYQKMPKPGVNGGGPPFSNWSSFARVYRPDLTSVMYSTILNTPWDTTAGGGGGSSVNFTGVFPYANGMVVTAYLNDSLGVAHGGGREIPTANVPASWGKTKSKKESAIFANFNFSTDLPISLNMGSNNTFCSSGGSGSYTNISFTPPSSALLTPPIATKNRYTLEISDASGKFAEDGGTTTIIGRFASTATTTQNIPVNFSGIVPGNNYGIRVRGIDTAGVPRNPIPGYWYPAIVVNTNPSKPGAIAGKQVICSNTDVNTIYTVNKTLNAVNYEWVITPTQSTCTLPGCFQDPFIDVCATTTTCAGVIAGGYKYTSDSSTSVQWNANFVGTAVIKVRGINACGIGVYSDSIFVTVGPCITTSFFGQYCADSATQVKIPFSTPLGTTFTAGNVFTAILSDSNGNFSSSQRILGSYAKTGGPAAFNDTIKVLLPTLLYGGSNYVVKVTASNSTPGNPGITGVASGNIQINPFPDTASTPQGTTIICINDPTLISGGTFSYTTTARYGATYQWEISPATAGTIVSGTSTTCTVIWNAVNGSYKIRARAINDCGTSKKGINSGWSNWQTVKIGCVTVSPIASSYCAGSTLNVNLTSLIAAKFDATTQFTLEISNQNGNFSGPLATASFTGVTLSSYPVSLTIPSNAQQSGLYLLRLRITNGTGYYGGSSNNVYAGNFPIIISSPVSTPTATPTGSTSGICGVAGSTYTTTGNASATSATSYSWALSPSGAGTFVGTPNGTTAQINWSNTYTGTKAFVTVSAITTCGVVASAPLAVTTNCSPPTCLAGAAAAPASGVLNDYRTSTSGNWENGANWQKWNGLAWVAAGVTYPGNDASANNVYVTLNMNVTSALTIGDNNSSINFNGNVTVNSGQSLTIKAGATAVVLTSKNLQTNDGAVVNNGTLIVNGTYTHNYTATAGTIPTATWCTGSLCEVKGYTSNAAAPSGLSQVFYDFKWNCASQGNNINLNGALTTVANNLIITTTNGTSKTLTLTSSNTPITVGGQLQQADGVLILNSGAALNNSNTISVGSVSLTGGVIEGGTNGAAGNLVCDGNFTVGNVYGGYGGGYGLYVGAAAGVNTSWSIGGNYSQSAGQFVVNGSSVGVQQLTINGNMANSGGQFYLGSQPTIGGYVYVKGNLSLTGNAEIQSNKNNNGSSYLTVNGNFTESGASNKVNDNNKTSLNFSLAGDFTQTAGQFSMLPGNYIRLYFIGNAVTQKVTINTTGGMFNNNAIHFIFQTTNNGTVQFQNSNIDIAGNTYWNSGNLDLNGFNFKPAAGLIVNGTSGSIIGTLSSSAGAPMFNSPALNLNSGIIKNAQDLFTFTSGLSYSLVGGGPQSYFTQNFRRNLNLNPPTGTVTGGPNWGNNVYIEFSNWNAANLADGSPVVLSGCNPAGINGVKFYAKLSNVGQSPIRYRLYYDAGLSNAVVQSGYSTTASSTILGFDNTILFPVGDASGTLYRGLVLNNAIANNNPAQTYGVTYSAAGPNEAIGSGIINMGLTSAGADNWNFRNITGGASILSSIASLTLNDEKVNANTRMGQSTSQINGYTGIGGVTSGSTINNTRAINLAQLNTGSYFAFGGPATKPGGTVPVCSACAIKNLTAIALDYNDVKYSSAVNYVLDNTYDGRDGSVTQETYPIVFRQNQSVKASITVTGTNVETSNQNVSPGNTPLVVFDGADSITFDGKGQWTFINMDTLQNSNVFILKNAASVNTLKNMNIQASSNNAAFTGAIYLAGSSASPGNSYNTFTNNIVGNNKNLRKTFTVTAIANNDRPGWPTGSVIDASNTTPIQITVPGNHNLTTSNQVKISGIGTGNTAANGTYYVKVNGANTFQLYTDMAATTSPVAGTGTPVNMNNSIIEIPIVTCSNTTPIVVTTAANHNLKTGYAVYITGATGNTGSNGAFLIDSLSPTTFSMRSSVGTGVYTGNGVFNTPPLIVTAAGHSLANGARIYFGGYTGVTSINNSFYAQVRDPNTLVVWNDQAFTNPSPITLPQWDNKTYSNGPIDVDTTGVRYYRNGVDGTVTGTTDKMIMRVQNITYSGNIVTVTMSANVFNLAIIPVGRPFGFALYGAQSSLGTGDFTKNINTVGSIHNIATVASANSFSYDMTTTYSFTTYPVGTHVPNTGIVNLQCYISYIHNTQPSPGVSPNNLEMGFNQTTGLANNDQFTMSGVKNVTTANGTFYWTSAGYGRTTFSCRTNPKTNVANTGLPIWGVSASPPYNGTAVSVYDKLMAYCFYAYSPGTALNVNNTVSSSQFYGFSTSGLWVDVNGNGSNWKITDNHFYYKYSTQIGGNTTALNFIPGGTSNNNIILRNYIGGQDVFCSGSPLTFAESTPYLFQGMRVDVGSYIPTLVQKNVFKNLDATAGQLMSGGYAGATNTIFGGIEVTGGLVTLGSLIDTTQGNIIGDTTITGRITSWTNGTGSFGIKVTNSSDPIVIANNKISGFCTSGPNGWGGPITGIYHSGKGAATISRNKIWNINGGSGSLGTQYKFNGAGMSISGTTLTITLSSSPFTPSEFGNSFTGTLGSFSGFSYPVGFSLVNYTSTFKIISANTVSCTIPLGITGSSVNTNIYLDKNQATLGTTGIWLNGSSKNYIIDSNNISKFPSYVFIDLYRTVGKLFPAKDCRGILITGDNSAGIVRKNSINRMNSLDKNNPNLGLASDLPPVYGIDYFANAGGSGWIFYNNQISFTNSTARGGGIAACIQTNHPAVIGLPAPRFYFNTAYFNNQYNYPPGNNTVTASFLRSGEGDVVLRNNIFYNVGLPGTSRKHYAIASFAKNNSSPAWSGALSSNYNVFYCYDKIGLFGGYHPGNGFSPILGTEAQTLSDWYNMSKADPPTVGNTSSGSIQSSVDFVNNPDFGDLHLSISNCPVKGKGINVNIFDDFDTTNDRDKVRPDCGINEFSRKIPGGSYWTGAVSTDWNDINNWCNYEVPHNYDDVTIDNKPDKPNYPLISATDAEANKLFINQYSGGTLALPTLGIDTAGVLNLYGNTNWNSASLYFLKNCYSGSQGTVNFAAPSGVLPDSQAISNIGQNGYGNIWVTNGGRKYIRSGLAIIKGYLRLDSGIIYSDATNKLILGSSGYTSAGKFGSYVEGPMGDSLKYSIASINICGPMAIISAPGVMINNGAQVRIYGTGMNAYVTSNSTAPQTNPIFVKALDANKYALYKDAAFTVPMSGSGIPAATAKLDIDLCIASVKDSTPIRLTIPNHNLYHGEVIKIQNLGGSFSGRLNNKSFSVRVQDGNNIWLYSLNATSNPSISNPFLNPVIAVGGAPTYTANSASMTVNVNSRFPTGKGGVFRPIELKVSANGAKPKLYTAEQFEGDASALYGLPLKGLPILPSLVGKDSIISISRNRYYDVSQNVRDSVRSGLIRLSFDDAERGGVSYANLRIVKDSAYVRGSSLTASGNTRWLHLRGKADSTSTLYKNTVINEYRPFQTFSKFALASVIQVIPLPFDLLAFDAALTEEGVLLNWKVIYRREVSHYIVQRSLDFVHFEDIMEVGTKSKTGIVSYQALDESALEINANEYYYRIVEVKKDGSIQYSNIARINVSTRFECSVYPNPFKELLRLDIGMDNGGIIKINLLNTLGIVIYSEKKEVVKGFNSHTLNLESLPSGTYILKIQTEDGMKIQKVIKQ